MLTRSHLVIFFWFCKIYSFVIPFVEHWCFVYGKYDENIRNIDDHEYQKVIGINSFNFVYNISLATFFWSTCPNRSLSKLPKVLARRPQEQSSSRGGRCPILGPDSCARRCARAGARDIWLPFVFKTKPNYDSDLLCFC